LARQLNPRENPLTTGNPKNLKGIQCALKIALDAATLYGGVTALLKNDGVKWRIIEIVFDVTDVHWLDYDRRFGALRKLGVDPIK